ncbi:hypothetical protein F4809DRAFT_128577 [Biscogniauxia mediterranea]|nr:hypothetical protein F4809DRAFT_128577 [Biscogniauxia mediterranea]
MRFTSIIVNGLFAAAVSAQTASEAPVSATSAIESETTALPTSAVSSPTATLASSTTVSVDPAQSSAASAIQQCLDACDADDTTCRAACIAVPSPDNANVNATTDCVAACPQGNGTAAENSAYGDCVQNCIGQYFFTSTGTPAATSGSSGSGSSASAHVTSVESTVTSDGSTFVTSVPSTVSGSGASQTSGSASSSTSDGAAARYGPVGTGLGLLGLFLAL